MIQKYLNIIRLYRASRDKEPDTWIIYCKSRENLLSAIHCAAFAQNALHKRHPHQYRLKKINLQFFEDNLTQKSASIKSSKTFDELYEIVRSCRVSGIGELTVYDTANRLGAYLNLHPQYIYLHAGTRAGVEKLIGKIRENKVNREQLPEPFKSSELSAAELEDIMCIYKRNLSEVH